MATVGQRLTAPESGYRRFDDRYSALKFSNPNATRQTYTGAYNNTFSYTNNDGVNTSDTIKFRFTGTKLIIGTYTGPTHSGVNVRVDGIDLGNFITKGTENTQIVSFVKTDFVDGDHLVELRNVDKSVTSSTYSLFALDYIDIDATGRLLHTDEVTDPDDLIVGKRIRCNYKVSVSGEIGIFSGLGKETKDFIPAASSATPDGDFYIICVDNERKGIRYKSIADRVIQHTIPWNTLNANGLASGVGRTSSAVSSKHTTVSTTGDGFAATIAGAGGARFGEGISSGKWYWEVRFYSGTYSFIGVGNASTPVANPVGATTQRSYSYTGSKYNGSSTDTYGATYAAGTTIGVALDMDAGTITFYKDGVSQGVAYSDVKSLGTVYPLLFSGSGSDTQSYRANFGDNGRPFSYPIPSGYVALKSTKYIVRMPTGGVSATDLDNEWDKYVVSSTLGGAISAGDNYVWNWSGVYSHASTVTSANSANRAARGSGTANTYHAGILTSNSGTTSGFRPVFIYDKVKIKPVFGGGVDKTTVGLEGVTLSGIIAHTESTPVSYKAILNGVQLFPTSGYTSLTIPPVNVNLSILDSQLVIGDNTIVLDIIDSNANRVVYTYTVHKTPVKKYLIQDNGYKTYQNYRWKSVGSVVSQSLFTQEGMDSLAQVCTTISQIDLVDSTPDVLGVGKVFRVTVEKNAMNVDIKKIGAV